MLSISKPHKNAKEIYLKHYVFHLHDYAPPELHTLVLTITSNYSRKGVNSKDCNLSITIISKAMIRCKFAVTIHNCPNPCKATTNNSCNRKSQFGAIGFGARQKAVLLDHQVKLYMFLKLSFLRCWMMITLSESSIYVVICL